MKRRVQTHNRLRSRKVHRRSPRLESLERRDLLAVTFEFRYLGTETFGFNDPVEGFEFRSALESAAARVGDQLLHDAVIQMDVFSRSFSGSAVAFAASESPPPLEDGGFAYRVIPAKIVDDVDLNGDLPDGRLEVFFFDSDDPFVYVTDPADGFDQDADSKAKLDFQAILIHELVHTLGFTSATNADGRDDRGRGVGSPGTWTMYDQFLSDSQGNRLINGDADSATAFQMDVSATGWPSLSVGGTGPGQGLYFDGPIASSVYGGPVPLYSPAVYSLASTGSHLDSEGTPGPSIFSPLTHLMSHATFVGEIPQGLTLLEKAMLADIGIMMAIDEGHDFGDAPESYPVQLDDDGARHFPSDLSLGIASDLEPDGQPSTLADGDGISDDGIDFLSSLLNVAGSSTTAAVMVHASNDAFLNAWIDWNQDGQWSDVEQIFADVPVQAGRSPLAFAVPANAKTGGTAARFRLSTQAELMPTGPAGDGEVEDYWVQVLGGSTNPDVVVNLATEASRIEWRNGDLAVVQGAITTFSAPAEGIENLRLLGNALDNHVVIDAESLPIPQFEWSLSGGDGLDTLEFDSADSIVDLRAWSLVVADFERLDVSSDESATILIDHSSFTQTFQSSSSIVVDLGTNDRFRVTDAEDWRMSDPIHAASFQVTATSLIDGQMIRAASDRAWRNLLQAADVNNDGEISAADALGIINELSRRIYSDAGTQQLIPATATSNWPHLYFDHNGDGLVSALDALRVINDVAGRRSASGESISLALTNRPHSEETRADERLTDAALGELF